MPMFVGASVDERITTNEPRRVTSLFRIRNRRVCAAPVPRTVTITDNGKGMNKEELANATEPFYTNSDEGTGLGLAITKEIIEDHGGQLTLTANPSGGMVVSFLLPRTLKDATLQS